MHSLSRLFVIAVLALSISGCGDEDVADTGTAACVGDPAVGAETYASRCASCHGPDGEGNEVGPALDEVAPTLDDLTLVDVMVNGTGTMPALALAESEACDVLAHLRATFGDHSGADG